MPPRHRWTGVNLEAVSRIVRAQFLRNFLSTEAENMFQLPTTVLSLVTNSCRPPLQVAEPAAHRQSVDQQTACNPEDVDEPCQQVPDKQIAVDRQVTSSCKLPTPPEA